MKNFNYRKCRVSALFKPVVLFSVFMVSAISNPVAAESFRTREPVLVSVDWLGENLTAPDLLVLHISGVIGEYENGHIEGARFLWPGWLIESNEQESTVPADIKKIKKKLEEIGVRNSSHIILCGRSGNLNQVCRIFITLESIGLGSNVSILEGGFDEWVSSGRKASMVTPASGKGKIIISERETFMDTDWVVRNMNNKDFQLIDARPKTAYEGTPDSPRQGHIPGAKNLPSTTLYEARSSHFASPEKLAELFSGLEIPPGSKPVFYCGTGNSACPAYVAAVIAGYDPLLYDGSMEAWSNRLDLPVEKE